MINTLFSRLTLIVFIVFLAACGEKNSAPNIENSLARSEAYLAQGQYKAAVIEAKNAIQADQQSIEGYLSLARIYNDLGQAYASIRLLEPRQDSSDPRLALLLAEAFITKGKIHSAGRVLDAIESELSTDQQTTYQLLLAEKHLRNKDFKKAQHQAEQILTDKPDNEKALLLLANIALSQNDKEFALVQLNKITTTKYKAEALQLKAMIAYRQQELNTAEELLTEALISLPQTDILTPQRSSVLRQLMHIITLQGRSAEALIYAKLLATAAPEQKQREEQLQQALAQYQKGDLDASKKTLQKIHDGVTNKEITGQYLGMISYMQGNVEEAEALLSEYIDPETASNKALHVLALSQLKLNKPQELIELIESDTQTYSDDAQLQALYGLALLQVKRFPEGVSALNKSIKLDPRLESAPLVLAKYYASGKQNEKAIATLEAAYQHQPNSKKLPSAIVEIYVRNESPAQAIRFIDESLKIHPDNANLHLLSGLLSLANNQTDKAKSELNKALSLDSSNPKILITLGKLALNNKNWSEAKQHFSQVIHLQPEASLGYLGLLQTHVLAGTSDEGIKQLQAMTKNSDYPAMANAVLAKYYLTIKNLDQAEHYANESTQQSVSNRFISATYQQVMATGARQAMAKKQYDEARIRIIKALEMSPDQPALLMMLARIEIESAQYKEAQKIAERLLASNPKSNLGYLIQGDIYHQQKQLQEASNSYRQAWDTEPNEMAAARLYGTLKQTDNNPQQFLASWLNQLPNSRRALTFMAMKKQTQGQKQEAIKLYEKLIQLGRPSALSLNNLAWLYFETSDKRANEVAKQAAKLAPNNPAILDTYGWILVNSGHLAEGIIALEKAAELAPDNQEIIGHLKQAKTN